MQKHWSSSQNFNWTTQLISLFKKHHKEEDEVYFSWDKAQFLVFRGFLKESVKNFGVIFSFLLIFCVFELHSSPDQPLRDDSWKKKHISGDFTEISIFLNVNDWKCPRFLHSAGSLSCFQPSFSSGSSACWSINRFTDFKLCYRLFDSDVKLVLNPEVFQCGRPQNKQQHDFSSSLSLHICFLQGWK